jgi:hypothetical protein
MEAQEEKFHQDLMSEGGVIKAYHPMLGNCSITVPAAMWEEIKRQDYIGYSMSIGPMSLNDNSHCTAQLVARSFCREGENEDEEE